jgi:DNA-binding NarL/FixJ family response regulator
VVDPPPSDLSEMANMDGVRVLLLAQSPVLRFGIRGILDGVLDIGEVAEADNALDAAASAQAFDPDLIVIQYALPGVNGMLAARMLRDLVPRAKIAVLSDYLSDADIVLALRHGADALLSAAIEPASFTQTIGDLLAGRAVLTDYVLEQPALAARVFDAVRSAGIGEDASYRSWALLTPGEIAILDGSVRGLSSREIGELTGIGEHAMKSLTTSLFAKLDATDRTTAIVAAVRTGLVQLNHHLPAQAPAPASHGPEVASAA